MVLNTSSLWSFLETGTFDFLRDIYKPVIIPLSVATEIKREGFRLPTGVEVRRLNGTQQGYANSIGLGAGENEAMVLAQEMNLSLIIDDGPAGETAERYGIDVFCSLEFFKNNYEGCGIEKEDYDEIVDAFEEHGRAHLGLVAWARRAIKIP